MKKIANQQSTKVTQDPQTTIAFLYATSFLAGVVVLSLEILGFRLFAPYFGYSVYVSGSLITLVLVALSVGYYLGGHLADKNSKLDLLYIFILISGIYLVIITIFYQKILWKLAALTPVLGTILGAVITFALPMVFLSMVSPFIIKYITAKDTKNIGKIVGKISALSTFGSIAGTILATFFFVPHFGSKITLIICDIIIITLALVYLVKRNKKIAIAGVSLLFLFFANKTIVIGSGKIVYLKESVYNFVKVFYEDNAFKLQLNDYNSVQSRFTATPQGSIFSKDWTDIMSVAPMLTGGNRILILGLGGGTSANQFALCYRDVNVDAVEIDTEVVNVAKTFFNVLNINPNLKIYVQDARPFLQNSLKTWDVIELDAFQGGPYMPFYLGTKEFFEKIKNHLSSDGVFVMNSLTDNKNKDGDELFYSIGNTIKSVFDSVYMYKSTDLPVNVIFFACNSMSLASIQSTLMENKDGKYLQNTEVLAHVNKSIKRYIPDDRYAILTDDKAPIEKMTYKFMKKIIAEAKKN